MLGPLEFLEEGEAMNILWRSEPVWHESEQRHEENNSLRRAAEPLWRRALPARKHSQQIAIGTFRIAHHNFISGEFMCEKNAHLISHKYLCPFFFGCSCALVSHTSFHRNILGAIQQFPRYFLHFVVPDNHRDKFQANSFVIHYRFLTGTWERENHSWAEILWEFNW